MKLGKLIELAVVRKSRTTAADGTTSLEVRLHEKTAWLTQAQMAELFQRDQSVISRHVSNVFKEGELSRESIMQKMHNAFPINPSPSQTAFYVHTLPTVQLVKPLAPLMKAVSKVAKRLHSWLAARCSALAKSRP